MTTRAVLYARVCVDDGENLTGQLEACRRYAHELGWSIVEELAEQGAGGSTANLPELEYMLELAQASAFDVLVVQDAYRLSREVTRLLSLESQLAQQGIKIEYRLPHDSTTTRNILQAACHLRRGRRGKRPLKQEKGAKGSD